MDKLQSPGRDRNAAQPLGERKGVISTSTTQTVGKESQTKTGPDSAKRPSQVEVKR